MGISAKKTCTEVTDERDSTSFYGAEYSWAPTETFGEYLFFLQSVWYNNEDGVSISNITNDVMDIGAFAENIIPSKFPDDDEEFFDANEFLDLN